MPTLVRVEGFEHGVLSTNGGGICSNITGSPTVQSTTKRTGMYALRINPSAEIWGVGYTITSTNIIVGRLYVRWATLPSANARIFRVATIGHNVKLKADNKFYADINTYGEQGGSVQAVVDTWYRLDFKIDASANPHTLDWSIDGVAQTQCTRAVAPASTTTINLASDLSCTEDMFIDDFVLSLTAGDYPIGAGGVVGLSPNAAGTSNPGTGVMQDNGSVDVDDATNPANIELDDVPISLNTDYIKQVATEITKYAEVNFADISQSTIHGAQGFLAYMAAAASPGDNGQARIRDSDGQETTIYSGDMSETSMFYKSAIIAVPSGGWTQAHVNALTGRVGYSSDVAPVPYWENLIIQVAYGEAGGAAQTLYPDAISSLEGFGGDKVNFILPGVGGIASLEAFGSSKFILYLLPSGIASLEEFGTDKISFTLLPSGILTEEGFGDGKLNFRLFPAGVESGEIFGSHTVTLLSGVQYLSPSSIASLESFGSPKLNLRLYAEAIVSSEAFGTGTIRLYLQPSSIESLEAFGSAKINFKLLIEAIQSAEAFGDLVVQWDQFIGPSGIATGESFGVLVVSFPGIVPVVIGVRTAAAGLSNRAPAGLKRTAGAGLRRDA